jgi:hypothetical protein
MPKKIRGSTDPLFFCLYLYIMLKRTIKKVPVKGNPEEKDLQKPCSECGKVKAIANKTKRLCASCVVKEKKAKQKVRKEIKRKIKQETITQTKLDQITSWLVRGAHINKCHACEITLDPKGLQCAHFVGRTKVSTRYHLTNLLPACPKCNLYTPHHVWNLGKSLNKIWGEDTTEDMLQLSNKILKLSNHDRKLIYDVYRTCLTDIEQGNYSQDQKYQKLREALHQYNKIVEPILK